MKLDETRLKETVDFWPTFLDDLQLKKLSNLILLVCNNILYK